MIHLRIALFLSLAFVPLCQSGSTDYDCIKGAIIGAALGDALGRVTEFIDTTKKIHAKYGPQGVTDFSSFKKDDWVLKPHTGKKIAAYTDDTILSLLVLQTAIDNRLQGGHCFNFAGQLAGKFMKFLGPDKYAMDELYLVRAHGITSINAVTELITASEKCKITDATWWMRGKKPEDFLGMKDPQVAHEGGCGSVMRAWPLGLVYWNLEEEALKGAYLQSILTHRHPMALAASTAVAVGVAHCIKNTMNQTPGTAHKRNPEEPVEAMIATATSYERSELLYKTNARKIEDDSEFSPILVAQDKLLTSDMIRYAQYMAKKGELPGKVLGTHNERLANHRSTEGFLLGWAADEAIAAAVYIFVRHPDDMQAALTEAVNTPGDSDSIATLVGALVGAHIGFKAFKHLYDWSLLENFEGLKHCATKAFSAAYRQQPLRA